MATGILVVFGQDDPVTLHLVDRADMLAVGPNDFMMFFHLIEQRSLSLPLIAPATEVVLELRLIVLAILVIVAVERVDLLLAPIGIMGVVIGTTGIARRTAARTAI